MWSKVAEEMAIPWRAAEAMHWQLGEQEMARRAGVVPFSLSSSAIDPPTPRTRRTSTSLSRPRKGSASRSIPPPQLPSVEELTAGVPAFAPHPPFAPPREAYRIGRPMDLSGTHSGHMNLGIPPRTLPWGQTNQVYASLSRFPCDYCSFSFLFLSHPCFLLHPNSVAL